MGRKVDVENLVSAQEIADLLDLSGPTTIHEWAKRHREFPAPVAVLSIGKVWNWPDVKAWAVATNRLTRDGQPVKLRGGRPKAPSA